MRSLAMVLGACALSTSAVAQPISLEFLGRYESGVFDEGAAEIAAYDASSHRVFVTNADANTVDALLISDPANPTLEFTIDLSPYGAGVNSVAVHDGLIAVAVEAEVAQDNGVVAFFDNEGNFQTQVEVGALPDMLTFTPNGLFLLVANEGEPDDDYVVDPEGSISVIYMPRGRMVQQSDVRTADFARFNNRRLDRSIRIFGPNATVAQDLEPEYITAPNDFVAYAVCQENNAIAEIFLPFARVTRLFGLGVKDHSAAGNELDASNRDGAINITSWPVYGFYLPDSIASYKVGNKTYVVTANEGDARDYDGFSEEERVGDLDLDPTAFPNAATLQLEENLGRLNITLTAGDPDGDGDYDAIFSYGARSFSIFDTRGRLVFDSGSDFEEITAAQIPDNFNSTNDENGSFDNRSDDKGPEPEALTLGEISGRTYAFIGAERVGGIFVYDITDPNAPEFVEYVTSRDFSGDPAAGTAGDLGPEGLVFIPGDESPTGDTLLVAAHEISGTTAIFRVVENTPPCYADCDGNGQLNVLDFFCFHQAFLSGDPYADCDGNGNINIFDFICFREAFFTGCP